MVVSRDLRATLHELEGLARKLAMPVRYDVIELGRKRGESSSRSEWVVRGGLCRLHGRSMIVCDARLPLVDKVVVIAEVLAAQGVEVMALPPLLRSLARRTPQQKKRASVSRRRRPLVLLREGET